MRELPGKLTAAELEELFEGRTRLVELLAERDDPLAAAPDVVGQLTLAEKREVLAAHPAIGQRGGLSARSQAEQGADGDAAVLAELDRLNAAYEERFGFRFLVFVNGRFQPALSRLGGLPAGLSAGSLAEAIDAPEVQSALTSVAAHDTAFTALNTALFEDAAVVRVASHAVVEAPVNVVFVSTGGPAPTVSFPRLLIVAGEHSQATVIESHVGVGEGTYFSCAVTEALCAEASVVRHYRVQRERGHGYHYSRLQLRAHRKATFVSHAFTLGGALVRNDVGAASRRIRAFRSPSNMRST